MSAFAVLRTAARSARPLRSSWPVASSSGIPSVTLPFRSLAFRPYSTEEKPSPASASKSEEGTSRNSSVSESVEDDGDDSSAQSDDQKIIAAKDAEILDLTSRLRYATADFQNLQRISEREKQTVKEFAISRFAADIIGTADVLALALKSVPESLRSDKEGNPKLVELYKGVELTQRQLAQTLATHGVTAYDPLGEKFDPNRHEALYSASAPEGTEPGTIIDVQKVGYTIKDRTLRAPQVGVAQEAS